MYICISEHQDWNPCRNFEAMKRTQSTTPTQVKGGYASAGSNFESVGVFVLMNTFTPKAIPSDIAMRCLEELATEIGKLEILHIEQKINRDVYHIQKHKLACKVLYYKECKRLFEKGQTA